MSEIEAVLDTARRAVRVSARSFPIPLDGMPLDFSTGSSLEKHRDVTNGWLHEVVLGALR